MLEPLERRGVWFPPTQPDYRTPGTLTFSQEQGGRLSLIGSFSDPLSGSLDQGYWNVLHGYSGGAEITLFRCRAIEQGITIGPGPGEVILSVQQVLLGHLYNHWDAVHLKGFRARLSHLDNWVHSHGIDIRPHDESVVITHKPPDSTHLQLTDDIILHLYPNVSRLSSADRSAEIIDESWLYLDGPLTLRAALNLIHLVCQFLTLGVGEGVYPILLRGVLPDKTRAVSGQRDLDIYYLLPHPPTNTGSRSWTEMLFTLPDIQERFEMYLKNWVRLSSELQPVYDLYFATLYNPSMYINQRFLNLVQGVEAFHRITRPQEGRELPRAQHRVRKRRVLDSVPDDLRKWLRNQLQYSNEVSLATRLTHLAEEHSFLFDNWPHGVSNYVRTAKNTRNYLTHYTADLKKKSASGPKLYLLTQKTRSLLEACLLKEIGVSEETLNALSFESP